MAEATNGKKSSTAEPAAGAGISTKPQAEGTSSYVPCLLTLINDFFEYTSVAFAIDTIRRLHFNGDMDIRYIIFIIVAPLLGSTLGKLLSTPISRMIGKDSFYEVRLTLAPIFTIFSGGSFGKHPGPIAITFGCMRFMRGFMLGKDFPLSASVFTDQGMGNSLNAILFMVLAVHMSVPSSDLLMGLSSYLSDFDSIDMAWRLVIIVNCIPTFLSLFFIKTDVYTNKDPKSYPKSTMSKTLMLAGYFIYALRWGYFVFERLPHGAFEGDAEL